MAELTRVDSAVQGLSTSPPKDSSPIMAKLARVDSAVQGLSISPPKDTSPIMAELNRVDSAVQGLSTSPPKDTSPIVAKLNRVDSAVQGLSISPPKDSSPIKEKFSHRRASSSAAGLLSLKELWDTRTKLQVAPETQKTGWKINTSPTSVDDKDILGKPLVTPLVKTIELSFETGITVTARNMKHGVTIKDAMDAIHSKNKKKADDEIEKPYLAGFEWFPDHTEYNEEDKEDKKTMEKHWRGLFIHLSTTPGVSSFGGKKKKKAAE